MDEKRLKEVLLLNEQKVRLELDIDRLEKMIRRYDPIFESNIINQSNPAFDSPLKPVVEIRVGEMNFIVPPESESAIDGILEAHLGYHKHKLRELKMKFEVL